ncbi:MAG: Asp-tRNA(Asn)/Glu-tRNA(Gln) amidotransferase subunit GatB [Phycisphaerales bacterium]|nr:MAG: Asp-tRNA(Asn)/Glu-tRNA(Gln) amidotransferase subunit GatB [Phycisphaerales bacterium]
MNENAGQPRLGDTGEARRRERVVSSTLIVGLEVHVELGTATKMFSRARSPVLAGSVGPNSLLDPTVLGLPGSLPTINRRAVELAIRVGLALRCSIARVTKWDRKSYFYPDLPKGYQISQYDLPLCFDGMAEVPAFDGHGVPEPQASMRQIRIVRAHLEEDAGKLLHEAPGGVAIDHSIVDLNRAGTPLLEIVTAPDFRSAAEVVAFARLLRLTCMHLGASPCVMQEGQIRFEPNINQELRLESGALVRTPIVEVKNLNSFKSLEGAIEHEARVQEERWRETGREHAPGAKTTRGWDDARGVTVLQREKEDAHDYRYFPDPDLLAMRVTEEMIDRARADESELPLARFRSLVEEAGVPGREAWSLVEDVEASVLQAGVASRLVERGVSAPRAGRVAANLVLQQGLRAANARGVSVGALGLEATRVATLGMLREAGTISNQSLDALFEALAEDPTIDVEAEARSRGMVVVRDEGALLAWVDQAIAAQPAAAADVQAGKTQAIGRLVGEVMKVSLGKADAKSVREAILSRLGAE